MDEHLDPEYFALLLVQQYLKERGYDAGVSHGSLRCACPHNRYHTALHATESQHGLHFVESKLPRGSMLMEMVYAHMEQQHHAECADPADDHWDAEAALPPLPADTAYPDAVHASLDNLHSSAVICVVPVAPGHALTAAGDGCIRLLDTDTPRCMWKTTVGGGAALCLAVRPEDDGVAVVACGSMDGSVALLDVYTGEVLASTAPHTKYDTHTIHTNFIFF